MGTVKLEFWSLKWQGQFILTLVISLLSVICLLYFRYDCVFLKETLWGLFIAGTNGLAAMWINRNAVTNQTAQPLFWGLGMNGIRALVLLVVVCLVHALSIPNFTPFLIATLVGYFCFLGIEIISLHIESMKSPVHPK